MSIIVCYKKKQLSKITFYIIPKIFPSSSISILVAIGTLFNPGIVMIVPVKQIINLGPVDSLTSLIWIVCSLELPNFRLSVID